MLIAEGCDERNDIKIMNLIYEILIIYLTLDF